jgi:hypothetical protein
MTRNRALAIYNRVAKSHHREIRQIVCSEDFWKKARAHSLRKNTIAQGVNHESRRVWRGLCAFLKVLGYFVCEHLSVERTAGDGTGRRGRDVCCR